MNEEFIRNCILEGLEDTTNIKGAARAIGVSVSWVEKHINLIPHHRIGTRLIFSKEKCREFSRRYSRENG